MIAHYGYMDGSGSYFITLDTDRCLSCLDYGCVDACPQGIFEIIVDDYDDRVASVKAEFRHRLKYVCAPCKPSSGYESLPCIGACQPQAISHSW